MAKMYVGVLANDYSGKAGSVVFAKTDQGTVVKPRVIPKNPETAAQTEVRNDFTRASGLWAALTTAQKQLWRDYAKAQARPGSKPNARNLYAGLTTKFELVNTTGTAPATPPTSAFLGDKIKVTAMGGAGKVTFTATAKNTTDVTTELLLQKLPNADRLPEKGGYRTAAYYIFDATLSTPVTLTPGWYAPAYRFVNNKTGQQQGILTLPVVQVS